MSTFKHQPTGKRFLFVHIPRTAGRFIEQNLMKGNDFVWDDKVMTDAEKLRVPMVVNTFSGSSWREA